MKKEKGIVTFTLAVSFECDIKDGEDSNDAVRRAAEEVVDTVRCGINKHSIINGTLITDEFMHDDWDWDIE